MLVSLYTMRTREQPRGCLDSNLGLLQEQVLLTAEPSLALGLIQVHVYGPWGTCGGQRTDCGRGLLLQGGYQSLNSGHRVWQRALFFTC